MVRRDYSTTTIRSFVQIVDAFRQHTGARLDRITPAQLRRYHLFFLEERRLAIGTVVTQIRALRFFCRYVRKRRDVREDLPYPKERHRLPVDPALHPSCCGKVLPTFAFPKVSSGAISETPRAFASFRRLGWTRLDVPFVSTFR